MKKISRDSKILSISHNDLDGVVSQIVLGHVYKNIVYLTTSFYKIDEVLQTINYDEYDYIFLTDISPTESYLLDLSNKIILLDHHESSSKLHNPSKMRFISKTMCGAMFTKKFIEKLYNIELTSLNRIVYLTNDYDLWLHNDPVSKDLNDIMFYKYRPDKFRKLFFDGHTTFTEEEQIWLNSRKVKFDKIYNDLEIYELDKLNGCVTYADEFINDICHKLIEEENYNIIILRNPNTGRVSIRANYDDINIGQILKDNSWGGGHAQAAGMFVDDLKDFTNKIKKLEEIISKDINNG